jgi:voltage-gated potassium channel Kch
VLRALIEAWILMAGCVVLHAVGIGLALRWARRRAVSIVRFWSWIGLFVTLAGWIVLLHLAEIVVWASFYVLTAALPEFESAVYFSAVTYTTTGYGDVVLPQDRRLAGAVEALTGILMCAWSTGFFFAVVGRMFRADVRADLDA